MVQEKETVPNSKLMKYVAISFAVFILGFLFVVFITSFKNKNQKTITQNDKKTNQEYQAVFLANNSVYFGKLKSETSQNVILADVYYLKKSVDLNDKTKTQLNLIKRGKELHGPEDEMRINRSQVLFIENVKPDSAVALAINRAKEQEISGANTQISPTSTLDKYLQIKNSETGFVRVRLEPSLEASETGKVKTGDKFKILSEQNNWMKVEYEPNSFGWVSGEYVDVYSQ